MRSRIASVADAVAITRIYNEGIEDRVATFETTPRTVDEVRSWFGGSYPVVVVEDEADVVAFAATGAFRSRDCFRRNAEFSVYVARDARGRGAGRLAMMALVDAARAAGFWKLLSGAFQENDVSLKLLRSLGFREVGTYEKHAQLDGHWKNVTIVERIVAPTVIFACVHNAGRSQMAAAWLSVLANPAKVHGLSAGTNPASTVHPEVLTVMSEVNIDLSKAVPALLSNDLAARATHLVTMGCGDDCPVVSGTKRDDWPLQDPKGRALDDVRRIRDDIRVRVEALIVRESWDA